ncbi:MAG: peptidylprolyl isomerase [Candidatus Acidiferrales bacterium]
MTMTIKKLAFVVGGAVLTLALPVFVHASGAVVEQIIARVNNDIITLSEYQKAEASLRPEAQQDCEGCTEAKINEMVDEEKKNLLRDLIDQSLLVQRGKDLDINVDTDVIKRLDAVRQQYNLPSMDALEKAVEDSGANWEDYKQRLKDSILQQKVIQQEVGPTIKISNDEIRKYYEAHQSEFVKPEEVDLSAIFFSTENKSPQEAAVIKAKAEALVKRLKAGEDFGALAKRFSEGPTASQEGELGEFKRGEMNPDMEKIVFALKKGDSTDVIEASNGLQILHVNQHFDSGLQPFSKVEDEIENELYQDKIQPALRKYVTQLRKDSYYVVSAGYTDSGAVSGNNVIQEVPYSTEKDKVKKKKTPKTDIGDPGDQNP